jgi:hypothetical protein
MVQNLFRDEFMAAEQFARAHGGSRSLQFGGRVIQGLTVGRMVADMARLREARLQGRARMSGPSDENLDEDGHLGRGSDRQGISTTSQTAHESLWGRSETSFVPTRHSVGNSGDTRHLTVEDCFPPESWVSNADGTVHIFKKKPEGPSHDAPPSYASLYGSGLSN